MYSVVVLYMGKSYEEHLGLMKFEEAKGNVKVVAVGVENPFAGMIDGWKMESVQAALNEDYEYVIVGGVQEIYGQITELLFQVGIPREKVFPITIFGIPNFDFSEYVTLVAKQVSIISNHCWGGITYHALKMQFLSPFINMFVMNEEYLRLLENLERYLSLPVEYEGEAEEINLHCMYPVGLLGDVHLHFNHYASFDEAVLKWDERKRRINMDNLFVEMYTTSREEAERFDRLPYANKKIFVPHSFGLQSEVSLEIFNDRIGGDIEHRFYQNVNGIAFDEVQYYDVIKLLNGREDFRRVS